MLQYGTATFTLHALIPPCVLRPITVMSMICFPHCCVSLLHYCPLVAATAPAAPAAAASVDAAGDESRWRCCGRLWFWCVLVVCVWMWILCPELTSVTIRTQPNSTACSRSLQPANSPEKVRAQKNRATLQSIYYKTQVHESWVKNKSLNLQTSQLTLLHSS